jgi:hypothetical protein
MAELKQLLSENLLMYNYVTASLTKIMKEIGQELKFWEVT